MCSAPVGLGANRTLISITLWFVVGVFVLKSVFYVKEI
jgi:hypothetical protein